MEIKYMQKLVDNPNLYNEEWSKNKPMNETEVNDLEQKYNNGSPFPKAFREYLLLDGKGGAVGVIDTDFDDLLEFCENDMEYFKVKLDRPFFTFNKHDSQYSIFFLDENKEDPICYIFNTSWSSEDEEPMLKESLTGTFSNLINEAIYRIKNNLPF